MIPLRQRLNKTRDRALSDPIFALNEDGNWLSQRNLIDSSRHYPIYLDGSADKQLDRHRLTWIEGTFTFAHLCHVCYLHRYISLTCKILLLSNYTSPPFEVSRSDWREPPAPLSLARWILDKYGRMASIKAVSGFARVRPFNPARGRGIRPSVPRRPWRSSGSPPAARASRA